MQKLGKVEGEARAEIAHNMVVCEGTRLTRERTIIVIYWYREHAEW